MRFLFLLPLACLAACASVPKLPGDAALPVPPAPDYSRAAHWAALPFTDDPADRTPGDSLEDGQVTAVADVFYIHPTIYFDTRKGNTYWNASLADAKLNQAVDDSAILNHGSIFNAAGKVYAPRYRQAHIKVFYERGSTVKDAALDTAYQDVLAAFDYYLQTYNHGRPIIIASHSQGTTHAKRLLADRFDAKPLRQQLVAAYLVGMPVSAQAYPTIPVCQSATETGCFVSWRTYREDFTPKSNYRDTVPSIAVVNPLSWTTRTERVPAEANLGGVLYNYGKGPLPGLVWAEIRGAGLFTNKPRFFGDILFNTKNYHIGDYNLFWMNVRENAVRRVEAFEGLVEGK
ncbi:DUF3089 domain-containing protein [Neolewinella lacunae]|uniref:DUF3089 domain-containing protein n=1 Tax=Neolewinella lacunae TaxID=1517758 RepID=A0A923PK68_9BACT|nr:DUF3089 domain-containing protein [Neolewinella lacunae]MBC6994191.1 DUF3089 domain-containing protein [Neolewinella lacunae]MDN3634650.1 DUF3089 domain-containing protein [Neolewinella lacunae]